MINFPLRKMTGANMENGLGVGRQALEKAFGIGRN